MNVFCDEMSEDVALKHKLHSTYAVKPHFNGEKNSRGKWFSTAASIVEAQMLKISENFVKNHVGGLGKVAHD